MPFPVLEAQIARAEGELGRRLPEPLRQRLLTDNGGEITVAGDNWQLFPIFDDSDRKRISRTANHIIRETAEARKWRGFPSGAIAVGANDMGELLVLLRNSDLIFVWYHETGELRPVP
jgi:hypothetical protein